MKRCLSFICFLLLVVFFASVAFSQPDSSRIYIPHQGIGVTNPGTGYKQIIKGSSTVGTKVFTGTGLNDLTFGGTYVGSTTPTVFEVEIDASVPSPDTFKWRKDTGAWTENVNITGAAQTLTEGMTITFAAVNGHTIGDNWKSTCTEVFGLDIKNPAGTSVIKVEGNTFVTLAESWLGPSSTTGIYFKSGKVGIGTTSPVSPLNVNSAFNNSTYGVGTFINAYSGATDTIGVYGQAMPQDYYGYGGFFEGGYTGARGQVYPTGSETYNGVFGIVDGGSGTNFAVRGEGLNGVNNYGGFFKGAVMAFSGATENASTTYGVLAETWAYAYEASSQAHVDSAYGLYSNISSLVYSGATSASIDNAYDLYVSNGTLAGSGTITNKYGLYIENQTAGSTLNYSIYSLGGVNYFGGNIGIGTTTFGTNAAKVLGIASGTAPTTAPANMVQIYSEDVSPDNCVFSVMQEMAPYAGVGVASTHKVPVRWNGTTYYMLATTIP